MKLIKRYICKIIGHKKAPLRMDWKYLCLRCKEWLD